jgi:hypothetical protein
MGCQTATSGAIRVLPAPESAFAPPDGAALLEADVAELDAPAAELLAVELLAVELDELLLDPNAAIASAVTIDMPIAPNLRLRTVYSLVVVSVTESLGGIPALGVNVV